MLRISELNRIAWCPGSLEAQEGLSEPTNNNLTNWAGFGDHGHACMEQSVLNRKLTMLPSEEHDVEELEKHCTNFLEIINSIVKDHGGWDKVGAVETEDNVILKLKAPPSISSEEFRVSGHLDLALYFPHKARLLVFDYKFGSLYVPRASANYQLGGYGIAKMQGWPLEDEPVDDVEIHLLSVGSGHSSYEFTQSEAQEMTEYLYKCVSIARQPGAPRRPGPHCTYCRALCTTACDETALAPKAVARYEAKPSTMTIENARKILSIKDAISKGIKIAEAMIRHNLELGNEDPDYYLSKSSVRKKITDPDGFAAAAENMGCVIDRVPKVTLGDIEKQLMQINGCTKKEATQIIEQDFTPHYSLTNTARQLKRK